MDNQNIKTLGETVLNRSQTQNQDQGMSGNQQQSFNTYLTVYSINLAHRFPDTSDVQNIAYDQVKHLAEFAYACSNVAVQTWDELQQDTQSDQRRQKMIARQTRVA